MSKDSNNRDSFQLSSGGLVHLIQQRIRGDEKGDYSIRLQIAFGVVVLWLPLAVLTLIEDTFSTGSTAKPFVQDIVPQVRFLIALPLLLLADLAIDPAVNVAIRSLDRSGVVPGEHINRLQASLARLTRARDSVWPDVFMLVLAIGFTWLFRPGYGDSAASIAGRSWLSTISDGSLQFSAAGWWYILVSAPLFQFVLFRWIWRFLIWADFLYRLSRVPLALQPTHPDLSGGLGILGLAQQTFTVVFVAFATVMSSTIAHNILYEGDTFRDSRIEIVVFIVACVVMIYAPLLFLVRQLYAARRVGLGQHGALGYRLSAAFSEKWIKGAGAGVGEELKNSTDPSAMADYAATFDAVRSMRMIPVTSRGIMVAAAALAAPFLPLYLTEFSIQELLQRMADALV